MLRRKGEKIVTLDDVTINKLADAITKRMQDRGENTMKFEDARFKLFKGKSREWIKYYILGHYPEVLTTNGGWITQPEHQGIRIKVVNVKAAKEWLAKNESKIDWNAPEPVTLRRRMGLVKPINRNNK